MSQFIKNLNSYGEIDELAKNTVNYVKDNKPEYNLHEVQTTDSLFYKVYNDVANRNILLGSYFAEHLKLKYGIVIPIV